LELEIEAPPSEPELPPGLELPMLPIDPESDEPPWEDWEDHCCESGLMEDQTSEGWPHVEDQVSESFEPSGLTEDFPMMDDYAMAEDFTICAVAPPPGLGQSYAELHDACDEIMWQDGANDCACALTISMPNKLLSEIMMEAILQQAGLTEEVISYSATQGKSFGQATVLFSSREVAMLALHHFNGCQWDACGSQVRAILSEGMQQEHVSEKQSRRREKAKRNSKAKKRDAAAETQSALSAKAAVFDPSAETHCAANEKRKGSKRGSTLSALAPVFHVHSC